MNETKYRKRAVELWEASKEETKQELLLELNTKHKKLMTLLANLKTVMTHMNSTQ